VSGKSGAGLFSALFIAVVPAYISRSVAGSYDNEGVAIFALIITFYLFLRALNRGSVFWACICSLTYFYMAAAWGGYAFIINIIPIFVVFQIITGKFTARLYVVYNVFYILGTCMTILVPFIGFQAVHSSEHMASHGAFLLLQVIVVLRFVRQHIPEQTFNRLKKLALFGSISFMILYFSYLTYTGKTRWSGRSLTLLDPTYAKKYIPIIASVSEHQPTTWSSYFFDLHFLLILTPVGLYYCFKKPDEGRIFIAIFGVLTAYFSGIMVRLMLVFAPVCCILSGIGVSEVVDNATVYLQNYDDWDDYINGRTDMSPPSSQGSKSSETKSSDRPSSGGRKRSRRPKSIPWEITVLMMSVMLLITSFYIFHCTWAAAEAYSSPSIILSTKNPDGSKLIVDDFRNSYQWVRMNTKPDAKILSWWDYGYQITGMANRTVLVDNNTWNTTHIAQVGKVLASNEEDAYVDLQELDVDYVLLTFGGLANFSGDDLNKFLWIIRIVSGVFPDIKEENFLNKGSYRIDETATPKMKESIMYKLSYYRFAEMYTQYEQPPGFDIVRQQVVGDSKIQLKHFTEVYTSENWMVRIFAVNKPPNRDESPSPREHRKLAKGEKLPQSPDHAVKMEPPRRRRVAQ